MAKIKSIKVRQIFGSRGNPTVEADVTLDDGTFDRAAVPSGASIGVYEALELRDGGSDYLGKGVSMAIENVNTIICPALVGMDPTEQTAIDNFMVQKLDGTVNEWGWCKQKLGANAILTVSRAICKAGVAVLKTPPYKENKEGLELLKTAIAKAGYTGKVVIGMDVAASEFYSGKDKTYNLNFKEENNDGSQKISGDALKDLYKSFVS